MPEKTFTPSNLNNASAAEEKLTLGEKLSAARKTHHLSIADVANELHLMVSMIEKIENNELDAQAPIFMRGYLRSYAKLVGVDGNEISTTMDEIEGTSPLTTKGNSTGKIKSKPGTRIVKIAFYLAIVVILVLLGNMWHKAKTPGAIIAHVQSELSNDQTDVENTPLADDISAQDDDITSASLRGTQ
jgi:cytoskeleton protein RodZ